MTNRLARVVEAMLRKLHREAMKRTLVETCDEALHNLSRQKLKAPELGKPIPVNRETQLQQFFKFLNEKHLGFFCSRSDIVAHIEF